MRANWLTEAIDRRQLVQYRIRNDLLLIEPHAYGIDPQGREILIGYTVPAAGRYHEAAGEWKMLEVGALGEAPSQRRFASARAIPAQYSDRLRVIYSQVK